MADTFMEHSLEPEANDYDFNLDDGLESDTTSIASSVYRFRQEYGRSYHAYREGSYLYPNDEEELDRLDLQHEMFRLMLRGAPHLAPVRPSPKHVLDIGTGTGLWAIEFAEQNPTTEVLGIDLSPTQPHQIPSNCQFQIDDANDPWTYTHQFDYIHVREMQMAIEERRLFRQAFGHLEPGGWFEIHGQAIPMLCDDSTLKGTALEKWSEQMLQIGRTIQRPFDNPYRYKQWMEEAGFINVRETRLPLPINGWPKDKRLKQVGKWEMANFSSGLEGFSLKLFREVLGYEGDELEEFLKQVGEDLVNRKIHAYLCLICVVGQKKPED